jgi:chromate transporter
MGLVEASTMTLEASQQPPAPVGFAEAFLYWLKLGFISFGGPAGQIAIMHRDLVEQKRWISEQRFLHALNYCMLLPGPEAQQLAIYIGWLMHRTWGGIVAGTLFVLPSFFILCLLAWLYLTYGEVPAVAGLLYGVKPAVTALVAFAAWRIGSRTLKNGLLIAIAAAAFLAIAWLHLPFPLIVFTAAALGMAGGRLAPHLFRPGGGHGKTAHHYGPALIDDSTPTPAHAVLSKARLLRVGLCGVGLWAMAMGGLLLADGLHAPLTQMGLFFTKAALLTFGGAYAVLPYVFQGAVGHYHWLSAPQMMDGLALGETTPGPLIMVVTFVGYVGGWNQALALQQPLWLAGTIAAAVVTFFTFLPSFVMIFLGGPLIEATHGDLKFTAPLTAITAAVVGVILNLALFFAYHVLWPQGFGGEFAWPAAIIGLVALVALFRYKVGVIPVILGCGAAGMVFRLITG